MASVVTNPSSVFVRALIAYSVHEHQEGAATRAVVTLAQHPEVMTGTGSITSWPPPGTS
jgi:hypothetical protein